MYVIGFFLIMAIWFVLFASFTGHGWHLLCKVLNGLRSCGGMLLTFGVTVIVVFAILCGFFTEQVIEWWRRVFGSGTPEQVKLYNLVTKAVQNGCKLSRFCLGSGAIQVNAPPYSGYGLGNRITVGGEEISHKLKTWQREKIRRLALGRLRKMQWDNFALEEAGLHKRKA